MILYYQHLGRPANASGSISRFVKLDDESSRSFATKPRRSIVADVTGKQDASHRHAYVVCASIFSDETIQTTQTLNLLTPDGEWVCGLWPASYWRLGLLLLRLLRISSSTYCSPVICGRQNNIGGTSSHSFSGVSPTHVHNHLC
jgi:hypothetical protein